MKYNGELVVAPKEKSTRGLQQAWKATVICCHTAYLPQALVSSPMKWDGWQWGHALNI